MLQLQDDVEAVGCALCSRSLAHPTQTHTLTLLCDRSGIASTSALITQFNMYVNARRRRRLRFANNIRKYRAYFWVVLNKVIYGKMHECATLYEYGCWFKLNTHKSKRTCLMMHFTNIAQHVNIKHATDEEDDASCSKQSNNRARCTWS